MEGTKVVDGFYGTGNRGEIFVYETKRGNWYCVKGSRNVCLTYDEIDTGVNVEVLNDIRSFIADKEIKTIKQLVKAVES